MTNEERDLINQFVARVGGAPAPSGFSSVPATQPAAPLPPVDRDADALIKQMFQRYPEAPYRMTQLAFVQEHGLAQAQNRIQQLEAQLAQTQEALTQAQQAPRQSGGFFGGLFGGGRQQAAPPPPNPGPWGGQQAAPPQYGQQPPYGQPQYGQPQYGQPQYGPPPQYAPGYQPGMFQRSGSGFLGSALTTAAGVAGGLVVGNMLTGLFTGHQGSSGSSGASGGAGADQGGGGWAGGAAAPSNQDYVDNGTWDQPQQNDNSWLGGGGDSGGGDWGGGGSDETF